MPPPPAKITPWAKHRLLAARRAVEEAVAYERRVIWEIHRAGDADPTAIAAALGVKNRQRINTILNDPDVASEPARPEMPPVIFLCGAGHKQPVWDRVEQAMWRRGWDTTKARKAAWHLARGGLDVVLCDFSATAGGRPRNVITVGLLAAEYDVEKHGENTRETLLSRVTGGQHPRPVRDGELDEHELAHLIEQELVTETLKAT